MNFSKLLCLVLVYSEQFGQVLAAAAETGAVCNGNAAGTAVTCKRKKGEDVTLKVTGTVTSWKKGTDPVNTATAKYEAKPSEKSLKIKALADDDEGEYTAGGNEKFLVQAVDCLGDTNTAALCQGKPGGSIELGLTGEGNSWKKAGGAITANGGKYGPVTEAILKINNLDDNDEAEFTGGPSTSEDEKFSVQVADCFGTAADNVECKAELGQKLKLRISDTVTGSEVKWEKQGGNLPVGKEEVGEKREGLKLPGLTAADVGTYTATYNGKTVSFAVSVPGVSGISTGGGGPKKPQGGGGGSSINSTDLGGGGGSGGDGSGGGILSYSPALLVTVTLVHLLLQLAA
ncbi:uncharacterized protein LOC133151272 [Syngnathus typhle]|uniref:uncharacterized protein LOC133151272 n=1 Tax=Syngnathus typhle TaxID=161592 RepID=UPI002A6ACB73|nr:uncharacterized protein LOC133151272 [Syngnathus typhle]